MATITTPLSALAPVSTRILVSAADIFEGRVFLDSTIRPDGTQVFLINADIVFADADVAIVHTYADAYTAALVFALA